MAIANLLELLSLAPERWFASLILLASAIILNELLRNALLVQYTRSVANHLMVSVLLMLPAVMVGGALLYGAYRHPERAWLNVLWIPALYAAWYAGGALTRLARPDTEGADVGWMAMGLVFVTVPSWILSIVLF